MTGAGADNALSNRRGHRRYPAWIEVALTDPEARTSAPATVVDMSLGGALVQTHQAIPIGATASLTMNSVRGPVSLEGRVVREEQEWTGNLLHLEFTEPDPATRLTLCRILDDLENDFRRHQQDIVATRL